MLFGILKTHHQQQKRINYIRRRDGLRKTGSLVNEHMKKKTKSHLSRVVLLDNRLPHANAILELLAALTPKKTLFVRGSSHHYIEMASGFSN